MVLSSLSVVVGVEIMMEQMIGRAAQLPSGSFQKLQHREGRGNLLRQQSPAFLSGT